MLNCKKEFIAGLLVAAISVSAATNISSLYAVEKKYSSEVEFSQRIGLFDSELLSEKTLKSNIAEIAFYRGLNLILVDKGVVNTFNTNNMEALGITKTADPLKSITRQKAAETILRAMMHAQNNGMIKVPENTKEVFFKDYVPDAKYRKMMAYAIQKGIFKSVSKNNFKPNKKLSVREALVFLKSLYELDMKTASSSIKTGKTYTPEVAKKPEVSQPKTKTVYIEPDVSKFFKDVSSNNPMAETVKKLINAGAFDEVDLNHELNLPKSIKAMDFAQICKSMIKKTGKIEKINSINEIEKSLSPNEALSRNLAVRMGAVMTNVYPHKEYNIKVNYTDVPVNSVEEKALKEVAKSGIKMGYSDGSFKGQEKVSRYEAFSLLGIIVGDNVGSKIKIETIEEPSKPVNQPAKVTNTTKPVQQQKVEQKEEKPVVKPTVKNNSQASKLEQQLKDKYDGLTFQQRIEMRKNQFRKILNRESTK